MIFVTLGTHHQPFDRLIESLALLPGPELVVQHGHSRPPAGVAVAVAFLPFEELRARVAEADVVITHAGVGSILTARRAGHVPIVVPRRHSEGEHVDDHQLELTGALADTGSVIPIWDMGELPGAVASAPARSGERRGDAGGLAEAVRTALRPAGARRARRVGPRRRRG